MPKYTIRLVCLLLPSIRCCCCDDIPTHVVRIHYIDIALFYSELPSTFFPRILSLTKQFSTLLLMFSHCCCDNTPTYPPILLADVCIHCIDIGIALFFPNLPSLVCFRMSPPTKRVSKKSTPAPSRLRANKPLEDDSDDEDGSSDRYVCIYGSVFFSRHNFSMRF